MWDIPDSMVCSFSPLFVGAKVETRRLSFGAVAFFCALSVPFSSGQGLKLIHKPPHLHNS